MITIIFPLAILPELEDGHSGQIGWLKQLIEELPVINRDVLLHIFAMLRRVAQNSNQNKMTSDNLAR